MSPRDASGFNKRNRREFLRTSAALAAGAGPLASLAPAEAHGVEGGSQRAPKVASNEGKRPLRLGLIIGIGSDPGAAMRTVHELGLPTCQAFADRFEPELAKALRSALEKYGIEATSLVVGGPGKEVWNFYEGPLTDRAGSPRDAGGANRAH